MFVAVSVLIGLLMSVNGVGYKVASLGKLPSIQSGAVLSACGMIAFGLIGHAEWQYADWRIAAAGTVFGITGYIGLKLLEIALKTGPLTPAWCAASLTFVPVIIYSAVFLHEPMSIWQWWALFFTVGSIIAASGGASGGTKVTSWKAKLIYGILLIGILIFISVLNTGLKFCSVHMMKNGRSMTENCGNLLIFFFYLALAAMAVLDLTLNRAWKFNRYFWWSTILVSSGGIGAYSITMLIINQVPAIILFAVSNAASILGAALISSFIMKEKRTPAWYLTVGFAVLAILFNR